VTPPRRPEPAPAGLFPRLSRWAPPGVAGLLIVAYIVLFGTLSLRRHQNLGTNALDLGYTDQAVWNTLHGRPFRFSTFVDAAFSLDIPIGQFRQPDVLLGYHVEPILALVAPLYLLHDGPETLLWLQTLALALGAVPLYAIARNRLAVRQSPNVVRHAAVDPQSDPAPFKGAAGPAAGASRCGVPCACLPWSGVGQGALRSTASFAVGRPLLRWLPVAFVLLYLLSPPLEAANLSDFHAVTLSVPLLLAAFYWLETGRSWGFVACATLAALCKEEIGLLVAMMGLWSALVARGSRRRALRSTLCLPALERGRPGRTAEYRFLCGGQAGSAVGLLTFVAGTAWFVVCVQVIMPTFSGLDGSPFLVRYAHLGNSLGEILQNALLRPGRLFDWLWQPAVAHYLRDLWLSSGGLAILYPPALALALPSIAINALSGNEWMRSGGGHYSAPIVPFLMIAAVYGVERLAWVAGNAAGRVGRRSRTPVNGASASVAAGQRRAYAMASLLVVALSLTVGLVQHRSMGASPLSRRFAMDPIGEHARRARPLIDRVNDLPADVPISAGSNLYPHVAHRRQVYLFPTVSDARFILLDVTAQPGVVGLGDLPALVRDLLDYGGFGVAQSDHGLMLLERDVAQGRLSPSFFDAFLADGAVPEVPLRADFSGMLRLEGFERSVRPVIRPERVVELTTYWRALSPVDDDYRLAFYFWDRDGRVVRVQPEEIASAWFPTWQWEPGTLVKVSLPPLPVGDLPHVGVAVLRPGADPADMAGRLVPISAVAGQPLTLWQGDTVVELARP